MPAGSQGPSKTPPHAARHSSSRCTAPSPPAATQPRPPTSTSPTLPSNPRGRRSLSASPPTSGDSPTEQNEKEVTTEEWIRTGLNQQLSASAQNPPHVSASTKLIPVGARRLKIKATSSEALGRASALPQSSQMLESFVGAIVDTAFHVGVVHVDDGERLEVVDRGGHTSVTSLPSRHQNLVKNTIQGSLYTFFALWRQRAHLTVPKDYRARTLDYLNSADFKATSNLTTAAREKATANPVDLEILIRALSFLRYPPNDPAPSSNPTAIAVLTRLSTGTITNLWIIPNPNDPLRPFVALVLKIDLLKKYRDNDSYFKYFFLITEPDTHQDVDGLIIFFITHPCTTALKLAMKESVLKQPVCRRQVYANGKWTTSLDQALAYSAAEHIPKQISLFLGFIMWFTFYCFQRCSAHNMNAALPEDERRTMMCQDLNSHQFLESYQSRLAAIDLGAILADQHETSRENMHTMKVFSRFSPITAGPNAEGRYPVPTCNIECTSALTNHGGLNVASHIHRCLMAQQRTEVKEEPEKSYTPRTCDWDGCASKDAVWPSRAAFCEHVEGHVRTVSQGRRSFEKCQGSNLPICRWRNSDGERCEEDDFDDLQLHLADKGRAVEDTALKGADESESFATSSTGASKRRAGSESDSGTAPPPLKRRVLEVRRSAVREEESCGHDGVSAGPSRQSLPVASEASRPVSQQPLSVHTVNQLTRASRGITVVTMYHRLLVFQDIREHMPEFCDKKTFRTWDPALPHSKRHQFGKYNLKLLYPAGCINLDSF
ncbi:hypothetical protein R3P38DRAFT_3476744 [Favolaschia claudopus]|uniref:Uncharacterized protein n=1 Tax=Favolaschia claudopus TaxID=2862362 RepID=A0AAV9ZB38_9AGAR